MKTLLLIRHAKTKKAVAGQKDFDRTLENKGVDDATEIANRNTIKNINIDLMVSSPAVRTVSTCNIFANEINIDASDIKLADELYNGPAYVYREIVAELENDKNTVAIFGHNFGIEDYANYLLSNGTIVVMKPGTVVALQADINNWEDFETADKKLLFIEMPNKL